MMADDLALMDAGRIIPTGTPQKLYAHPTSVAAARLLGPLNLVAARVSEGVATSSLGRKAFSSPDGPAWMAIRPTDLKLTGQQDGLGARVVSVSFAGGFNVVRARAGFETLLLHLTGQAPAVGAVVGVAVDAERLMMLPV